MANINRKTLTVVGRTLNVPYVSQYAKEPTTFAGYPAAPFSGFDLDSIKQEHWMYIAAGGAAFLLLIMMAKKKKRRRAAAAASKSSAPAPSSTPAIIKVS